MEVEELAMVELPEAVVVSSGDSDGGGDGVVGGNGSCGGI